MIPCPAYPTKNFPTLQTKSVAVWGKEALLDYVMEFLLQALPGRRIVRLPANEKTETLLTLAEAADPEALILCETHRPENGISADSFPAQFIRRHEHIKVLVLNPGDNRVEVIDKHMILVQQSSDLLSLIENHPAENLFSQSK
ncbi:MAG: hypothetical protein OHK0031_04960 [Anaerolineales bacterium]